MEQFSKGVHRALVLPTPTAGETPDVRMLTQTDVVRFLIKARADSRSLQELFVQPIGQLGKPVHKSRLVTVNDTQPVLSALRTMIEAGVHAAAVVHEQSGMLLSNFSMSDLRGAHFILFFASVLPSSQ
jgi:hypothetical protein